MIKTLGALILAVLAIGTGLSLYLPDYPPVDKPPGFTFRTIEETLTEPVAAKLLQPSTQIFGTETEEFALHLGIYGSLFDAQNGALLFNKKGLTIEPAIIKVQQQKRQWFVLLLGPFASEHEANKYQQSLASQGISSQAALWPPL